MAGMQTIWQTNPRQGSCLARSPSTCLRCLLFSSLSSKANRLRTWLTRATREIGVSSLYHSKLKSGRKIHRFLIRQLCVQVRTNSFSYMRVLWRWSKQESYIFAGTLVCKEKTINSISLIPSEKWNPIFILNKKRKSWG